MGDFMLFDRTVGIFLILLLLSACASNVPVNIGPPTAAVETSDPEELLTRLAAQPLATGKTSDAPKQSLVMPRAGSKNAFGMAVTPALEKAYDAYLAGDGEAALAALDTEAGVDALTAKEGWHRASLRAQTLIMMGRSGDADAALDRAAVLEKAGFGRDVFSRAQRGEALVWLGEYDRAVDVLAPVAAELATWRLPTSYGGPPTNLDELVWITTAQLRTYTALAGQYLLRDEIAKAKIWAARAETLYADVHYVADHPLYGAHLKVYADSYYGRALNQTFLAAAETVAQKDTAAGKPGFARADAYYDVLGYKPGKVTTQALRAWAALAAGNIAEAESEATTAVKLAVDMNFADLVWRVQVLRGEALLAAGRAAEAEAVFRSADAAVDAVSGALSSDRAKRRFGVGKEDITYRLVQFGLTKNDLDSVFTDLERGRARAFVDMLAGHSVAADRGGPLAARLQEIDAQVRNLRLISSSAGSADAPEVATLLQERSNLVNQLVSRDPELGDVYAVRTATLPQVRNGLPKDGVMLYGLPARGKEKIKFLAISPDGVSVVDSATTSDDLKSAIARFTDGIALADAKMQTEAAGSLRTGLAIAAWPQISTAYVVPTGNLFFVPWGAVVDNVSVAVLPTATWVVRNRASKTGGAVVVGDPAFGGAMPQLEGARVEAEQVARLHDVTPLTGRAATIDAVRRAVAGRTGLLHLATHGRFDAAYPLRSALYFTDGNGQAAELTAADLYSTPLAADVVVLSACETGAGKAEAGDDFLGLVRGFYLSGSRTVINSLWPVDDAGTQQFMSVFHENLKKNDAAAAWLIARDAAKAAGLPPSVYGAFVLGGVPGGPAVR